MCVYACVFSLFAPPHPNQLGTFRSPEGEYFVEPLHSYQGEEYEEEHTKPHIVYRKTAARKRKAAAATSGTSTTEEQEGEGAEEDDGQESSACDASGAEPSGVAS